MTSLSTPTQRLAGILVILVVCLGSGHLWADEPWLAPPRDIAVRDDEEDLAGTQLKVTGLPPEEPPAEGWELVAYACWSLEVGQEEPKFSELLVPPFAEMLECTASGLLPNRAYLVRMDAIYAPEGVDWLVPGQRPPTEGRLGPEVPTVLRDEVPVIDLAAIAVAEEADVEFDSVAHTIETTLAGKRVRATIGEAKLWVDEAVILLPRPVTLGTPEVVSRPTARISPPVEVPVVPLAAALDMPVGKPLEPEVASAQSSEPIRPVGRWYDPKLSNRLVGVVLISAVFLLALYFARRREMYIRPIAGLEAVNDAIGRATEMGKPILYISGLGGVSDIATIAAMLILGHLAKRTAAYETDILVPCNEPLVMAAEREIVREAYVEAGRPDAYNQDNIFYITDSQFSYVAAVDGIMMRERPAANFYMGYFAAESLILAETGNYTGAIQIAGTDADTQLPFFITACDYTLMGEELYAAGAYLSRAPVLLAQLKGQDIGKVIFVLLLVAGTIATTIGVFSPHSWLQTFVEFFNTQ